MGLEKRNNALKLNGNYKNGALADIAITTRGSDWYFTVCAVMTLAGFIFIGLSFRKPRRDRLFHYITAAVVFVAAIAYFTMGSNLGFTPIQVEFSRSDPKVRGTFREIFYVRYIDWFITTPLLLMDLMLTAGMPWPTILWVVMVDWIMIVTGLVGALVQSRYKWGFFTFGCAALVYIVYHLVWESRRNANAYGRDIGRAFLFCGSLTTMLWILYPIAWGVCEGGNVVAPDSEAVFYGILDLLAKPVFGALLIWGHRNIDPGMLGLAIKDYEGDVAVHGRSEKGGRQAEPVVPANDGHANGHGATPADTTATTAV
ncbi:family A G protein-coupled receptor-like protein [Trematosphaeria pertusa]|uniref:Family A G protein-coupled receptor-like protein n=1 Tax=Trematosphaeria pertusa TaxID=390896 RepID=A0A6A6HR93_9PLEO|nr:family A G protein-coupled receptor-like protein [Trematosphaeria pertusa]KAF2240389.1 family A G protein-coupled receptor-like protein [Trematosphaeria pertusa]